MYECINGERGRYSENFGARITENGVIVGRM
jgi:hypothetical protein